MLRYRSISFFLTSWLIAHPTSTQAALSKAGQPTVARLRGHTAQNLAFRPATNSLAPLQLNISPFLPPSQLVANPPFNVNAVNLTVHIPAGITPQISDEISAAGLYHGRRSISEPGKIENQGPLITELSNLNQAAFNSAGQGQTGVVQTRLNALFEGSSNHRDNAALVATHYWGHIVFPTTHKRPQPGIAQKQYKPIPPNRPFFSVEDSSRRLAEVVERIVSYSLIPRKPSQIFHSFLQGKTRRPLTDFVIEVLASLDTLPSNPGKGLKQGLLMGQSPPASLETFLGRKFLDISRWLLLNYAGPIRNMAQLDAALEAMVSSLGDHYSEFLTEDRFKRLKYRKEGNFSGPGWLYDTLSAEGLTKLFYVVPGSPAEAAGLKIGDEIVAMRSDSAALSDQKIHLTVRRTDSKNGQVSQFSATLLGNMERQVPNIFSELLPDGVAYLYIDSFRRDTDKQALTTLRRLKRQGMRSLILDLRYNPGGDGQSALNLASQFLKKDQKLLLIQGHNMNNVLGLVRKDGKFSDRNFLVTILINRYTASASETLAGVLQDHKRARVIGERSYGKNVGQTYIPLQDGSMLRLTAFRVLTPNGLSLKNGLTPDTVVKTSDSREKRLRIKILNRIFGESADELNVKEDPVLRKALELAGK